MRTIITAFRTCSRREALARLTFPVLVLAAGTAPCAESSASAAAAAAPSPSTVAAPTPAQPPVAATAPAGPASPAAPIPSMTQEQLLEREAKHDPALFVLDVRTPKEYAEGHVPGAVNVPHDQVAARLAEIPKDRDVVLYCHSGRRAGIAAATLKAQGYSRLYHLEGDMMAWADRKQPLEK